MPNSAGYFLGRGINAGALSRAKPFKVSAKSGLPQWIAIAAARYAP